MSVCVGMKKKFSFQPDADCVLWSVPLVCMSAVVVLLVVETLPAFTNLKKNYFHNHSGPNLIY